MYEGITAAQTSQFFIIYGRQRLLEDGSGGNGGVYCYLKAAAAL